MKKKKRKKINKNEKKQFHMWEKLFILTNISIIFIIMGIYIHRATYYYKKLNYIEPHSKLIEVINNENNITYTGDGLYKEDDNNYYYKGKNVNNYLLYSGLLWRIINVDSIGIKLISDTSITSLVWGSNSNYENSFVNRWLNEKIINNLSNKNYIVRTKWCNNSTDIDKYNCENDLESEIGLITIEEYLKAGGNNSYLNNEEYFWTMNFSKDNKAYYIHNLGGINNDIGESTSLYSYGIRPSIYINFNILHIDGIGTKDNPYIIEEDNYSIGDYIKYKEYLWKIIEIKDEYIKVILDGYLKEDNEDIKLPYDKINTYLNNSFIKLLNVNDLVKINSIETIYNSQNNYNYLDTYTNRIEYISIPTVSELFITDYPEIWLNTYQNTNQKLVYIVANNNSLLGDLTNEEHYIRPIIAFKKDINITKGIGTKDNPYQIGDSK